MPEPVQYLPGVGAGSPVGFSLGLVLALLIFAVALYMLWKSRTAW